MKEGWSHIVVKICSCVIYKACHMLPSHIAFHFISNFLEPDNRYVIECYCNDACCESTKPNDQYILLVILTEIM